jgi:homoserine dehydrogenase
MKRKINIGLIGFGNIGSALAEYLISRKKFLKAKTGVDFELKGIVEKDKKKVSSPYSFLLTDVGQLLSNSEIDVIVELIGGIEPARSYIISALKNYKHVITANKALLAESGDQIFKLAEKYNLYLGYEASVCGGIPIIKDVSQSLISNEIQEILGIVNGTSNYILTIMEEKGITMREAIKIAQQKGYAESNPSLDIDGIDSAHKLAILIRLAFGYAPRFKSIFKEGIREISPQDIKYAQELGYKIKLLAIAKRKGRNIEARVHPTLLPTNHVLASVRGVYNAVYLKADLVGNMLFYGRGAGKSPTTSALISDLVEVARFYENQKGASFEYYRNPKIDGLINIDKISSRYYVRFMAVDKPGVLAKISGVLGKYNISIASVTQKERRKAKSVPIVMMTHEAREKDMEKALSQIQKLDVITANPVYIRVEE